LIAGQPGSKLQHGPLDVVAVILDVMAVFNVFFITTAIGHSEFCPKKAHGINGNSAPKIPRLM
jgi:hypothetical protein